MAALLGELPEPLDDLQVALEVVAVEGLVAAAMFWYVTVAIYAVIWYAIYVAK